MILNRFINNKPLLYYGGLIAGILLVVLLLLLTKPEPEAKLQDIAPLKVLITEVKRSSFAPAERATGRLQPALRADLRFEVSGNIRARLVEPGVRVEEGQVLLALEDGDFRDMLVEAEAEYQLEEQGVKRDKRLHKLARNSRRLQGEEVKRLEKLRQQSLLSHSHVDTSRQKLLELEAEESRLEYLVNTSQSRLQLKQSAVERARRNLERAQLKAPFAGIVNSTDVHIGNYVSPNQPVLVLVDADQLDLYLEVRGDVAANLELGKTIDVEVEGFQRQGEIIALQSDPDPSTNTHALRIRLQGNQARAGMLATALLPLLKQDDVLTIPVTALMTFNSQPHVFVYRLGFVYRNPVTLGARIGDQYVVLNGLHEGERIAARDVAALADGQQVLAEYVAGS